MPSLFHLRRLPRVILFTSSPSITMCSLLCVLADSRRSHGTVNGSESAAAAAAAAATSTKPHPLTYSCPPLVAAAAAVLSLGAGFTLTPCFLSHMSAAASSTHSSEPDLQMREQVLHFHFRFTDQNGLTAQTVEQDTRHPKHVVPQQS